MISCEEVSMSVDRILTVRQVADRLGARPETIRRWIRAGRINGVMLGGTKSGYRILESEVGRVMGGPRRQAQVEEGE